MNVTLTINVITFNTDVIKPLTINVIKFAHKCNKQAMTSKSRGRKLAILFVHFLLQDTRLVHQVNILINPETKTEEAVIMVCEHIKEVPKYD